VFMHLVHKGAPFSYDVSYLLLSEMNPALKFILLNKRYGRKVIFHFVYFVRKGTSFSQDLSLSIC